IETTSVEVKDLPEAIQHQLNDGISVSNEEEARYTIDRYRDQIDADKTRAAATAQAASSSQGASQEGHVLEGSDSETGDAIPEQAAGVGMQAQIAAEEEAAAQSLAGLTEEAGE
ncbi:MAG: hypothetical protein U0J70_07140, partial [Atopobiaceae bacterium]|nr:hypothetical protein [Atopobiaceae bacterium]